LAPRELRVASIDLVRRLELGRFAELVRMFAAKGIKARYRGSVLGVYWSLSNPIIMTLVYSALFGTAFASYYNHSVVNYMLACFTGLAVLGFFSNATSQALTSVVASGALLNKIYLPKSLFPTAVVAANAFQYIVGTLPILMVVTLVTSRSVVNLAALVVVSLSLLIVAMGFAFGLSAAFVFFRDLPYMYELVVFVMWITSPIFYPAELVPPMIRPFVVLNPLAVIMSSVRQIALSGSAPDPSLIVASFASAAFWFMIGTSIFIAARKDFMDLI
jgi:ABC-type polysaccharide/polyol phosphate export permease